MDILPTQIIEDDFMPTQKLSHSLPYEAVQEKMQIGTLRIGSTTYPINRGITKIGRHPNCSIILLDQTVSKKHAEIEANSGETWICDMNSSNQTILNGSALRPGRYYQLKGGSVIEFGMVRAVYSELNSVDESLILETPIASRLKTVNTVIPGTPDTSINYSSTLETETSMIPGTQADKEDSLFRRPSTPARSSTNSRKSYLPDSSIENSMHESKGSLFLPRKENQDEQRVSIHDIETQKSFESQNNLSTDIHDVETQKICLSSCSSPHPDKQTDIHDIETQPEDTNSQCNVTDIHDIETQHDDVDIHSLETPRKIDVQNVSVKGDENTSSVNAEQIKEAELMVDESSMKAHKNETQSEEAIVEKDENSTLSKQFEISRRSSQECLELSITTNFDDECSEHDESRNLLESPNLLVDFIDDDSVDKSRPKSISHSNSLVNNNEMTEKSSDEENIFDAATQININTENILEKVTQQVDYAFKTSMEDDSDDTDQEGVFQRYSRVDSQDSSQGKSQTKRQSDSEDSDTDDEGHFTAIAAKEKKAASMSLELRQNECKQNKNDAGSSGESDDLFDIPTQKVSLNGKDSSKGQGDISKDSVDFDTPTQVIEMHVLENMTEKKNLDMDAPTQLIEINEPVSNMEHKDTEDIDDLMPTQIIPSMEVSTNVNLTKDNTKHNKEKEEADVQYNTPTQIIAEVPIYNEPSPNDPDQLNPHLVDEFSVEDIDYEMAPTQLLADIEEKKKTTSTKKKSKSRNSKKVNLDDTLERNLNAMFDDVNENIEDQSQISTQVLTNILQSSQSEETSTDLNIDKETPKSNRENMSTSRVRNKSPIVKPEVSPVLTNRKSRRSSLRKATNHNDSQDYFSNLTSTRKRNILVDSQDSDSLNGDVADSKKEVETESVNKIVNNENIAPAVLLKSASENSSSTRLSRTNKAEELNKFESIIEKTDSPKSNKNAIGDSGKGDEKYNTSVDAGPSELSVSTLESDEEDIMSGLPEVRISGTLSNPASPTSSTSTEFKLCTRSTKSRSGAKKAETRKKGAPRKSTRKSVTRVNAENNAPSKVSKSRTTVVSSIFTNFDADKIPMTIPESNENEINEIMPAKRMSSRKSLQTEPNPPQEEVRDSPSIQGNGRTRATTKKDVDSTSAFQVSKEVLIAKETEPARKTAPRALRGVKRSLSSTGVTESTAVKKFKVDVGEKTFVAIKGRKNNARSVPATRSNSANILDYIMRKDSPVFNSDSSQQSLTSSQENAETKQLRITITRLSSNTPTLPLSPSTAVDLTTENGQATINKAISTSSEEESGRSTTERTKRNNSRRATSKRNVEDISEQVGEESQEVEMIMNSWVEGQGINVNVKNQEETNENAKSVRTRSTRKRGHTSTNTSEEIIENTSSEVYELDNPSFEVPTKAKRARTSRNTTNVDKVAANDTTTRERRNIATNNTVSKETTKKGKKKGNAQKVVTEEKNEVSILEETTFSEINSSMDMSAMSTPTRSKRNMSTSFATSSPYKIKHKILFTGISNDYTKLLTKLGSSQVEDPTKCTVLVTDKVRRTVKFLCALAQAVPIVSISWLVESEKAGHFAELDNYVLKDPAAEAKFGFRLRGSLEKAKKQKLLDGYTVLLTPNVAPPLPELKSIINSCGGKPLVRPPTKWPEKAVIVSREEDIATAKKFIAKAPTTVTIQSTEFILTGILRQELDFIKYKLT
nr:mediator of DNA damage checkpoint protein 1-like isoform X1 [Megalopta genalis]XP_033323149.1 mediator of DNA damage checkpoint protein 1-like isoform X1 [Megalopta genalis]